MEPGSGSGKQCDPSTGEAPPSSQPWIDDFADGGYYACYWRTRPLLGQPLPNEAMQLMLISLQRLELGAELAVASELVLKTTAASPWHQALVMVTLGDRDFTSLVPEARTPERRGQLLFYAGARQATLGGGGAARALLEESERIGGAIVEARLAAIELARESPSPGTKPVESIVSARLRLAGLSLRRGAQRQAMAAAGSALAVVREQLGCDHLLAAAGLDLLGEALHGTRDPTTQGPAVACHEEALAIRLKAFGRGSPESSTGLHNVGFTLSTQGRGEAALGYLVEALQIRRGFLGDNHVATASTVVCIARVLLRLGEEVGAGHYLRLYLAICRHVFGESHPATIEAAQELRRVAVHAPSSAAITDAFGRAEPIRWERFGEGSVAAAERLIELARVFRQATDAGGACFYLRRALAICRKVDRDQVVTSTCPRRAREPVARDARARRGPAVYRGVSGDSPAAVRRPSRSHGREPAQPRGPPGGHGRTPRRYPAPQRRGRRSAPPPRGPASGACRVTRTPRLPSSFGDQGPAGCTLVLRGRAVHPQAAVGHDAPPRGRDSLPTGGVAVGVAVPWPCATMPGGGARDPATAARPGRVGDCRDPPAPGDGGGEAGSVRLRETAHRGSDRDQSAAPWRRRRRCRKCQAYAWCGDVLSRAGTRRPRSRCSRHCPS